MSFFLISQPFVARGEVDDATIGKAVLGMPLTLALRLKPPPVWRERSNVLHDAVVFVGVNADVHIMGEAEVHDVVEDTVDIWIAGDTMYDVIGFYVIQPLTIVYL